MAGKFVRASKFRHVFGPPGKVDSTFTVRGVYDGATDGFICAVNPKFIAVSTKPQGGGAFLILTHDEEKRVDAEHPQVKGHKGKVLDLAWNPFNDNIIASGDDYASVHIWDIPENGLEDGDILEPRLTLSGHEKKIVKIMWHPCAENILLTSAYDQTIKIWNLMTTEVILDIKCPDVPYGFAWSYDGGRLATTCRDKYCRIYDAHTGDELKKWQAHDGPKSQMIAFTKEGILTTGFSRMSQREYALFDEESLREKTKVIIDDSNGVNIITYDHDTGMFYLAAKGDSIIRYFEVTEEAPYVHYLSSYSALPQTCAAAMPKRGVDVNINEVMRFFRIEKATKGNTSLYNIIPTAMRVPRKSDMFQDDLFPETPSDEPALTASEWEAGQTKPPLLMSLKTGYKTKQKTSAVGKMANKMPAKDIFSKKPAASSGVPSAELKNQQDEIKSLKSRVGHQEAKIASLEKQLATVQDNSDRLTALESLVTELDSKVDSLGSGDAE